MRHEHPEQPKLPEVARRPGRPRQYASNAERQAAYRERKGRPMTIFLPPELADEFAAYMRRQMMDGAALDASGIIAKLIRSQLLRKR